MFQPISKTLRIIIQSKIKNVTYLIRLPTITTHLQPASLAGCAAGAWLTETLGVALAGCFTLHRGSGDPPAATDI